MSPVLVIRGGAVGDLILTLPVLRLLRERFPDRRIELLAQPPAAALAAALALVDRTRPLESRGLARFFVPDAGLDDEWVACFASFDVIVSYLFDPDDFFHANLARSSPALILRGPSKPAASGPHASLQLAQPLHHLGLSLDETDWRRPFRSSAPSPGAPVALHPGSGSPIKSWDPTHWRQVARDLHRRHQVRFLIVSGETETGWIETFHLALDADSIPFDSADQLPLPTLFEALARCRLFLGHDTGPSHLAAAAGVPSVLVFGPTDPAVWAPPGPHVTVVQDPSRLIAAVTPDAVLAAAASHLSRDADPAE